VTIELTLEKCIGNWIDFYTLLWSFILLSIFDDHDNHSLLDIGIAVFARERKINPVEKMKSK